MLSKIMKAANIDWPQMPYLLHLWDGKKSNLVQLCLWSVQYQEMSV